MIPAATSHGAVSPVDVEPLGRRRRDRAERQPHRSFRCGTAPAGAQDRVGKAPLGEAGYGPLVADPAGLLSLPAGFSYTVVASRGSPRLESGEPTPSDPDGTASFVRRGGDGSVLVVNHEVSGGEPYPVPRISALTYDPAAGGGTTNVEVDKDGNRVGEYVSLAGTQNNCAGGKSPWHTWLTCEEAESLSGQTKPHGYVFEVDPYDQDANRDPKPIKALGRYAHEALVDRPRHAARSTSPRTPATPTACCTAGPRRRRSCRSARAC